MIFNKLKWNLRRKFLLLQDYRLEGRSIMDGFEMLSYRDTYRDFLGIEAPVTDQIKRVLRRGTVAHVGATPRRKKKNVESRDPVKIWAKRKKAETAAKAEGMRKPKPQKTTRGTPIVKEPPEPEEPRSTPYHILKGKEMEEFNRRVQEGIARRYNEYLIKVAGERVLWLVDELDYSDEFLDKIERRIAKGTMTKDELFAMGDYFSDKLEESEAITAEILEESMQKLRELKKLEADVEGRLRFGGGFFDLSYSGRGLPQLNITASKIIFFNGQAKAMHYIGRYFVDPIVSLFQKIFGQWGGKVLYRR